MPSASTIAVMCRRQSLRLVATAHHHSLLPNSVVSASGKGFAIAKQHQAVAWDAHATATRCAFT